MNSGLLEMYFQALSNLSADFQIFGTVNQFKPRDPFWEINIENLAPEINWTCQHLSNEPKKSQNGY